MNLPHQTEAWRLDVQKLLDHAYIFTTILLTVYSQLVIRWQMSLLQPPPDVLSDRLEFFTLALLRPWVLSALLATFVGGLCWMMALTKFQLSYAFPFMALNFLLIMVSGVFLLGESLTPAKLLGNALIILGVFVLARGQE